MNSRVLCCVVALAVAGCHAVRASSPVAGTRAQLADATRAVATRLGWEAHLADSGQLVLITTPNGVMTVEPRDNALNATSLHSELNELDLLAAAVENELTGRRGEALTTRSGPLAVGLGAVLPFVSTLYLGSNDPVAASMGLSFGSSMALHVAMDLVAVQMAWLALSDARGPIERWVFVSYAITAAVANRVIAIVNGVRVVDQRNAWAASGVEVPTAAQLDRATELRRVLW